MTDDRTPERADGGAVDRADRAADPSGDRAVARVGDRAGRDPGELVVTLSPRQVVGGFAVVAGLIVWFLRRVRRKG